MKKLLLPAIILFVTVIIPIDVLASSLEVSKSSSFSSGDLNFAGGETVYVRVKTDKPGSSSVLNIRDNNYSSVGTINLNRNGVSYFANFSAPSLEGYYSLEAKIEGEGMSVTSVKTIKVGSPTSANIKVNVNSSVKGTSTKEVSNVSNGSKNSENVKEEKKSEVSENQNDVEVFAVEQKVEKEESKSFFGMMFGVFRGAWNFFKFF